jgi:hypothetical protein
MPRPGRVARRLAIVCFVCALVRDGGIVGGPAQADEQRPTPRSAQNGATAIYDGCLASVFDTAAAAWMCTLSGLGTDPDPRGGSALYGYARPMTVGHPVAIFRACVRTFTDDIGQVSCAAVGLRPTAAPSDPSTLIGYAAAADGPGARPLFYGCLTPTINDEFRTVTGCRDHGLRATADPWGFSSLIGWVDVRDADHRTGMSSRAPAAH